MGKVISKQTSFKRKNKDSRSNLTVGPNDLWYRDSKSKEVKLFAKYHTMNPAKLDMRQMKPEPEIVSSYLTPEAQHLSNNITSDPDPEPELGSIDLTQDPEQFSSNIFPEPEIVSSYLIPEPQHLSSNITLELKDFSSYGTLTLEELLSDLAPELEGLLSNLPPEPKLSRLKPELVDLLMSLTPKLDDLLRNLTPEPKDLSSYHTLEPEDLLSNLTSELEDLSNNVSLEPEELSSNLTLKPEDLPSNLTPKLEDLSSNLTPKPEDLSSNLNLTPKPEDLTSNLTPKPEDLSSNLTPKPEDLSSNLTPKPEDLSNNLTAEPEDLSSNLTAEPEDFNETISRKNVTACYSIPENKVKIHLRIKNAGRLIQNIDLTEKDTSFLRNVHSFEMESPGQIGIPSKWDLSLSVNIMEVDETNCNLHLRLARRAIIPPSPTASSNNRQNTNQPDSNVLLPVWSNWQGNIYAVCNDLLNDKNLADRKIRTFFENIPTQTEPRKPGYNHNRYADSTFEGGRLGWITWNKETMDALNAVSRSSRMDLVVNGYIYFTGLFVQEDKVESSRNMSFVNQSNKEWLDIRRSLLQGSLKRFSDVKFIFPNSNVQIEAYRIVLASFSPVFAKMFQTTMTEKETGEVTIEDVSPDAMNYALELLYMGGTSCDRCGTPADSSKSEINWIKYAGEVVYMADKYQIESLKQFCDMNLSRNCANGNVLDLLRTAKLYGLEKAKRDILRFIETDL